MNWNSLGDFLDMGGYALYVWGSYGLCALALGWELVGLTHRRRRALDEVRAWRSLEDTDHGPAA